MCEGARGRHRTRWSILPVMNPRRHGSGRRALWCLLLKGCVAVAGCSKLPSTTPLTTLLLTQSYPEQERARVIIFEAEGC